MNCAHCSKSIEGEPALSRYLYEEICTDCAREESLQEALEKAHKKSYRKAVRKKVYIIDRRG